MANADESDKKDAQPSSSDHVRLEISILASDSEDSASMASDETAADGARSRVVLVVAPDRDMRTYVRRCLSLHREIRVVEAGDDEKALRSARTAKPEVVILDMDGPSPSNAVRGRKLHTDAALARVPMIVITDEEPGEDLAELVGGELPGVIIVKPFNARRLCNEVEQLLGL